MPCLWLICTNTVWYNYSILNFLQTLHNLEFISGPRRRVLRYPWWYHQMETFSALQALCAGNSPVPVNSSHTGQWRGALMFPLICAWINVWANNRESGDLTRHRAHYDVIEMSKGVSQLVNILLQSSQCCMREHLISNIAKVYLPMAQRASINFVH